MVLTSGNSKGKSFQAQLKKLFPQVYLYQSSTNFLRTSYLFLILVRLNILHRPSWVIILKSLTFIALFSIHALKNWFR